MNKIRLDLDALEIDSFDVTDSPADRGTVQAYRTWGGEGCPPSNDYCVPSYEARCWWTGDPMQDCLPASIDIVPCTDHQC